MYRNAQHGGRCCGVMGGQRVDVLAAGGVVELWVVMDEKKVRFNSGIGAIFVERGDMRGWGQE